MRKAFAFALPLIMGGSLSAASGESAHPCSAAAALSGFDYLVLASVADSQRPLSMAMYQRLEVAVQLEKN
jgi:hypothetical protein